MHLFFLDRIFAEACGEKGTAVNLTLGKAGKLMAIKRP